MTDAELVLGAQRGETAALRALYQRYLPAVWRYVYGRLDGDRPVAEDVVSETFLAAVRGVRQLDPERALVSGWLIGIARNKLADHWRGAKRTLRLVRQAELVEAGRGVVADVATTVEAAEARSRVAEVMGRLPDDERIVLEWKYFEDLPVREIAQRLGRTEKAVEATLYRARRAVRAHLEECE